MTMKPPTFFLKETSFHCVLLINIAFKETHTSIGTFFIASCLSCYTIQSCDKSKDCPAWLWQLTAAVCCSAVDTKMGADNLPIWLLMTSWYIIKKKMATGFSIDDILQSEEEKTFKRIQEILDTQKAIQEQCSVSIYI